MLVAFLVLASFVGGGHRPDPLSLVDNELLVVNKGSQWEIALNIKNNSERPIILATRFDCFSVGWKRSDWDKALVRADVNEKLPLLSTRNYVDIMPKKTITVHYFILPTQSHAVLPKEVAVSYDENSVPIEVLRKYPVSTGAKPQTLSRAVKIRYLFHQ